MIQSKLLARAPDNCPFCGAEIRAALSSRHSVGLGPEGRLLSAFAMPSGIVAAVVVAFTLDLGWIAGYGVFGTGLTVAFLVHLMATTCQKTWSVRCRDCGWNAEVVYRPDNRPPRS